MVDNGKQAQQLEELRKKARLSYFYLGFGLLLVLVAVLFLDPVYSICTGGLVLLIYTGLLKKEIRQYQNAYREAVTLNSIGRYIQTLSFVRKNIILLESVRQDGCVPIEDIRGIVRAGIWGAYQGEKVCLTDISYTCHIPGDHGQGRMIPVSGCYIRMELPCDTGVSAVFCGKKLLPEEMIGCYYEKQGNLRVRELPGRLEESVFVYARGRWDDWPAREIGSILSELNQFATGQFVVKIDDKYLYGFVRFRYLGACEPDYKHPVTADRLEVELFPEIRLFLNIADRLRETCISRGKEGNR